MAYVMFVICKTIVLKVCFKMNFTNQLTNYCGVISVIDWSALIAF